ncbi:MAG: endonuclease III [Chloroflexi bacterium]|nr:endonuclease III [Chloroflexota bacterium]
MSREDTARLAQVIRLLAREYDVPPWEPRLQPLAELMFTILSQHTSDVNAFRAFQRLQATWGSWEAVAQAEVAAIEQAIRTAGLSRVKAPRIKEVLQQILAHRGDLNLGFLKEMPPGEALAWLERLPGVGPKTARCVLLFSLGIPVFPVDTHVHRVTRRLGLVGLRVSAEEAHRILEAIVPPEAVYSFHVSLVNHGRKVCKAPTPLCQRCVVESLCSSSLLRHPELAVSGASKMSKKG